MSWGNGNANANAEKLLESERKFLVFFDKSLPNLKKKPKRASPLWEDVAR